MIPTIDIGPFLDGDAAAKRRVAEQVARTCERTGFLIISGHRFPGELLERAQQQLFAFFDLPVEKKNRWHPSGASRQRGYHGFATRGSPTPWASRRRPICAKRCFSARWRTTAVTTRECLRRRRAMRRT